MTSELVKEIAGYVFALGIVGTGVYMHINGMEIPPWMHTAIGAGIGLLIPGAQQAVKARFIKKN
jgi:hypothetical protein